MMGSCVIDFMGFRVDGSDNEVRSNRVIRSNLALQYIAYLKFWSFRFFFIIIKCELISFTINLNVASFYKIFNIFNYMFLLIVLLT